MKQITDIKNRLWLPRAGGRDGREEKVWELEIRRCRLLYKMDKQQGPNVSHRELYSMSCDKLHWKRI